MRELEMLKTYLRHPIAIHAMWVLIVPFSLFILGAASADLLGGWELLSILLALWCWVLALAVIGAYLYFLRCRYRLAYGIIEIVAALGIVTVSLITTVSVNVRPTTDYVLWWASSFSPWLQLAAAIYILVRGLDNIGEGLKVYPRASRIWRRVFTGE
jgi:hypothetical protein